MKKHEKMGYYFGVSAAVSLIACLLYWLTGKTNTIGLRMWATLATLALPMAVGFAWYLATMSAREHLTGFERGLTGAENMVTKMGRSLSATARMAKQAAQPVPSLPANDDDLLPPVRRQQITIKQTGDVIDM